MIDTLLSRLSRSPELPSPASQDGFMLIEVLLSSLLVALIAIATFTGFDVTQRVTQDERAHNQATMLAQQDEERLRGMTVSELELVGVKTRTVTSGGTTYTITSSAQFVTAGSSNEDQLACTAGKGTATYMQTTSSVSWTALGKRPPVTQSSNIRVPTSTSLLVRVNNRNNEGFKGATIKVYDPSTASTPTTESTTTESGCATFGGLAEGTAKVVVSNGEAIDHSGNKAPEKTVTIGSTMAETSFTLETPGAIQVKFVSEGLAVPGLTFFALQTELPSPPDYVGGSPTTASLTAQQTNLFPFVTPGKPWKENRYTVYAGDCEKNNPVSVTGGVVKEAPSVQVEPGSTTAPVSVEVPPVNVIVYEGTSSTPLGHPTSSLQTAMIINTECKTSSAQNYTTVPFEHKVNLTSAGTIEQKYQPFAKQMEFCAVELVSGTYYKYKSPTPFENKSKAGVTLANVYLQEANTSLGYSKNTSKLTCP